MAKNKATNGDGQPADAAPEQSPEQPAEPPAPPAHDNRRDPGRVVLLADVALGNGTRKAGDCLATLPAGVAPNLKSAKLKREPGVEKREIETLALNPQLYRVIK